MNNLGISIYPNHSDLEADKRYIEQAAEHGFKRVFTCLLSVEEDKEQIINDFKESIRYARVRDMEVICDITPRIFDELGISYDDLSFFNDLGVDGIRLDVGYTGKEEVLMSFNPYDLKIEFNMSNATSYIDNIMALHPARDKITGCHNFYPHRYSGLAYDFFIECSKKFKKYNLRTAAFVSSNAATYGPWPLMEGLPTLEEHREISIDVQAKHLSATGLIDDIIISNAYASEDELKKLSEIDADVPSFNVKVKDYTTELEEKIVFEEPHFYRGDVSEYMIRSTQSRVKYKDETFKPHTTKNVERGDIVIDNERYMQYEGELQIALKDMKNTGKTNVVGRIREEEIFLLDYLKPWQHFQFQKM